MKFSGHFLWWSDIIGVSLFECNKLFQNSQRKKLIAYHRLINDSKTGSIFAWGWRGTITNNWWDRDNGKEKRDIGRAVTRFRPVLAVKSGCITVKEQTIWRNRYQRNDVLEKNHHLEIAIFYTRNEIFRILILRLASIRNNPPRLFLIVKEKIQGALGNAHRHLHRDSLEARWNDF